MALITLESLDSLAGDLAEETRLPRELIARFGEMWHGRERPFFAHVDDDGCLPHDALLETVRSLRVSSTLLCRSIARVIAGGEGASVHFDQFVRGYAKIHSRTLKEALPFCFAVFDLDGDGILEQARLAPIARPPSSIAPEPRPHASASAHSYP